MTTFAYVRVSDSTKQDSQTQRHTIASYAKDQGQTIHSWMEFHLSGSKTTSEARGIAQLVGELKVGDIVLVSDIARLGRDSAMDVMGIIIDILRAGAALHLCYSKTTITPEDKDDIGKLFMALGEAWAAARFAKERSQKAKAACERRKAAGLHNGRKAGAEVRSKLDDHATFILRELDRGTPKTKLLSLLENRGVKVARSRLYSWIDDRLKGQGIQKNA